MTVWILCFCAGACLYLLTVELIRLIKIYFFKKKADQIFTKFIEENGTEEFLEVLRENGWKIEQTEDKLGNVVILFEKEEK